MLDRKCQVQRVLTDPADPYDVEDLARTADGTLWLSDTGDNRGKRERGRRRAGARRPERDVAGDAEGCGTRREAGVVGCVSVSVGLTGG